MLAKTLICASLAALILANCGNSLINDLTDPLWTQFVNKEDFGPDIKPFSFDVWNSGDLDDCIRSISSHGNGKPNNPKNYVITFHAGVSKNGDPGGPTFHDSSNNPVSHIAVSLRGNHRVTLNTSGALFSIGAGQRLIIRGLDLTGGNIAPLVTINGGELVLRDGNIRDNQVTAPGGGVYINGGTFIMYGGTISGNTAISNYGGGVYVFGGTFTIYGGTITGNTAASGGGVYVDASGTFNLFPPAVSGSNGNIRNNSANGFTSNLFEGGILRW